MVNNVGNFRETRLWQVAFAGLPAGSRADWANRLASSFEAFHRRAAILAGEIAIDLPSYTVHDVTHLDALWEMGTEIAGESITLNPVEAYLFGGAVLCHDLAMSEAAYPNRRADIEAHALYKQGLFNLYPGRDEASLDSEELQKIRAWVLRENHPHQASQLPMQGWKSATAIDGFDYLIEDSLLRQVLGPRIGQFAESHWWPLSRVIHDLSRIVGPPGGMPPEWEIDEFKIAALLRAADAAHIDTRRAPSFLFSLRKLSGIPKDHWQFQNLLWLGKRKGDRLYYTSSRSFTVAEADAWWLCYDTISMIHSELAAIDAYLGEQRPEMRFAARGVFGAGDPEELSRYVGVRDWFPIDARPTIGDVAQLIDKLGGAALYGDERLVPVRELLQNSIDACEALKLERPQLGRHAKIECSLSRESDHTIKFVVDDTGVGMSKAVVVNALLNFGSSLWESELLRRELPRLAERRFRSSGRFGIGFFSVFMWSSRVKVTTRKYGAANADTLVVEFRNGLQGRPILRQAEHGEQRDEPGTTVEVWLDDADVLRLNASETKISLDRAFVDSVLHILAFPPVPISIVTESTSRSLDPIDWKELSVSGEAKPSTPPAAVGFWMSVRNGTCYVRPIVEQGGEVTGLAGFAVASYATPPALVVGDGGLRLGSVANCIGVFRGEVTNAARDRIRLSSSHGALVKWASEQRELLLSEGMDSDHQVDLASRVVALGADPGGLIVAHSGRGPLTIAQIKSWAINRDMIVLTTGLFSDPNLIEFSDGVLSTKAPRQNRVEVRSSLDGSLNRFVDLGDTRDGLEEVIVNAIVDAWAGCTDDREAAIQEMHIDRTFFNIGRRRIELLDPREMLRTDENLYRSFYCMGLFRNSNTQVPPELRPLEQGSR